MLNKKLIILSTLLALNTLSASTYLSKISKSKFNDIVITNEINNNQNTQEPVTPQYYESCNEILQSGQSTGDGNYEILSNAELITVYCDMTTDGGGWTRVDKSQRNNTLIGDSRQHVKLTSFLGNYGAGQGIHIIGFFSSNNLGVNLLAGMSKPSTTNSYTPANGDGYNYFGGHMYFANNNIDHTVLNYNNSVVIFSNGIVGQIRFASNGSTSFNEHAYIYYSAYDYELYERL